MENFIVRLFGNYFMLRQFNLLVTCITQLILHSMNLKPTGCNPWALARDYTFQ